MQEQNPLTKPNKISRLYTLRLNALLRELPKVTATDAEKILLRKAKDFGKDPPALITLIKIAEKFPELKSAIDNTHLIETPSLDIEATEQVLREETSEIFRELRNVIQHRKRLALKKPRNDPDDSPLAAVEKINPKKHEKDSIEDLTKYLINNPASGYYFLRQPHRQKELAANPVLIAKMIAGDSNLRYNNALKIIKLFYTDNKF